MNTTNAQPTAAQMYEARMSDIARLIDLLHMELDTHAGEAKAEPTNWGYAGDLARVRGKLMDAITSIAPVDHDDLEVFLAE